MIKVTVLPYNRTFSANPGDTVFSVMREQGVDIGGFCGGKGTCGKCRVVVAEGNVSGQMMPDGAYLACRTEILSDLVLSIPEVKDASGRKSALHGELAAPSAASVKKIFVRLAKPTVSDQRPDWERLISSLPEGTGGRPSLELLKSLPRLLREGDFEVTAVVRDGKVIGVEKGDTTSRAYGVAFDIGTTTVVGSIVDLNTGNTLKTLSAANPQRAAGADVISRIEYAGSPGGGEFLQEKMITALNGLIDRLLEESGADRRYLYEAAAAGNTTMQHLLLGINPTSLARAPYVPVVKSGLDLPADNLGLNLAAGGIVYVLPNIAGFVGSDTVAVVLSTGMHHRDGIRLAVDIGTNGEIVLGSREEMLVCSTAAGPAFEGARIACGMRADHGAIEGVRIGEETVTCEVIGNTSPVSGICGSGLIQAAAEMLRAGIIDGTGRMLSSTLAREKLGAALAERIVSREGENIFIVVPEDRGTGQRAIFISQKDIRELQLAKGAIAAGIQILIKEMNIGPGDIEEVLLAGAFGSYIDRDSARAIGLVPPLPPDKIKSVGNAAGLGARMALLSGDARREAEEIALRAKHVELACRPDFHETFIDAMSFPGPEPSMPQDFFK